MYPFPVPYFLYFLYRYLLKHPWREFDTCFPIWSVGTASNKSMVTASISYRCTIRYRVVVGIRAIRATFSSHWHSMIKRAIAHRSD